MAGGDRAVEGTFRPPIRSVEQNWPPPSPSGANLRKGGGFCVVDALSSVARPPCLPSSAVVAGGAPRAARSGSSRAGARGVPARAGGSGRQRDVLGRSVGTAEAPEPGNPPRSDVPALRSPRARAAGQLWGCWGFDVALSAASRGWRAAAADFNPRIGGVMFATTASPRVGAACTVSRSLASPGRQGSAVGAPPPATGAVSAPGRLGICLQTRTGGPSSLLPRTLAGRSGPRPEVLLSTRPTPVGLT